MIKKAYLLMTFCIIIVLLVCITFFINLKYDLDFSMKLALIWAFGFLGVQCYLWSKKIKREEKEKLSSKKNKEENDD